MSQHTTDDSGIRSSSNFKNTSDRVNGVVNDLPEELLAYIFSYLRITILIRVQGVCRAWRNSCRTYNVCKSALTRQVTHMRYFDPTNAGFPIEKLAALTQKRFFILGGINSLDMADITETISQRGLQVEAWDMSKHRYELPSLETLKKYPAVLVFNRSNAFINQTTELGDLLASYLEQGHGGVVQCMFAINSNCLGGNPEGNFLQKKYCPIEYLTQEEFVTPTSLLKKIPDHFLFTGVEKFEQPIAAWCNPSNRLIDFEKNKRHLAQIVATFDSGMQTIAVATRELEEQNAGRVCVLNFYPASSNSKSLFSKRFWNKNTNGGELLVNALLYCGIKCL